MTLGVQAANAHRTPLKAERLEHSDTSVVYTDVAKRFGRPPRTHEVLKSVSFEAKSGRLTSVIGPSGCGKTTLLNMASGISGPTDGYVTIGGRRILTVDEARSLGVGFVTQEANLLPWMTVLQNVSLPLKIRNIARVEREEIAREWIEKVGLGGFENHYPAQLSGGMQKRCSLARTLVYRPPVVLMDEPFGALDALTKLAMQDLLSHLLQDVGAVTALLVTHDITEAIALSDEIVVITGSPGTVERLITVDIPRPRDVYYIDEADGFDELYVTLRRMVLRKEPVASPNEGTLNEGTLLES